MQKVIIIFISAVAASTSFLPPPPSAEAPDLTSWRRRDTNFPGNWVVARRPFKVPQNRERSLRHTVIDPHESEYGFAACTFFEHASSEEYHQEPWSSHSSDYDSFSGEEVWSMPDFSSDESDISRLNTMDSSFTDEYTLDMSSVIDAATTKKEA